METVRNEDEQLTPRRLRGGLLIAFEGIDGAGKTTQAKMAVARLQDEGFDAVYLREPTDGPYGKRLRELMVAGREKISPQEEFELFLLDRKEDVERNIRPALERGAIVCIDRYYLSSMAYQGALGLDPAMIQRENEKIAPVPDLILYFHLPVEICLQRIRQSRDTGLNLFEQQAYQERVAKMFEQMHFSQWVQLDATLDIQTLHDLVMRVIHGAISTRLGSDR